MGVLPTLGCRRGARITQDKCIGDLKLENGFTRSLGQLGKPTLNGPVYFYLFFDFWVRVRWFVRLMVATSNLAFCVIVRGVFPSSSKSNQFGRHFPRTVKKMPFRAGSILY